MRRGIRIVAAFFCFSGAASASQFSLELKAQYFSPAEQAFKDIYGGGLLSSGEIALRIWKNLEVWAKASYFSKKGELTFTKEETSLRIAPLGGGLKARIQAGRAEFYAGLGLLYYLYKESNPIGEVSKEGMGFEVKAGVLLNLFKALFLDLCLDYAYCRIKPADFEINIGGFSTGFGLGYRF